MESIKEVLMIHTPVRVYTNGDIYRQSKSKNKEWKLVKASMTKTGYLKCAFDKKFFYVHRIVAHAFLGLDIDDSVLQVDHINLNKKDNTIENLRLVSCRENSYNKNSKGYCWDKDRLKWMANIRYNGMSKFIGRYETKEEAHQAYLDAKKVYHIIPNKSPRNYV